MIKILFFFTLISNLYAHHHIESTTPTSGSGIMSALRVFKKTEKINYLAELAYADVQNQDHYKTFEVGGKYRLLRNLKLGAYYGRHFKDTGDENVGILELSPRFLLDFLPGERWVGEFRVRYIENFSRHERSLRMRPGLTYFWFRNGSPFINFFAQYEFYRSLDYGAKAVYAHWSYLGALYHHSEIVKFSPFFSYAIEKTGVWYNIKHKSKLFGVNVLFYL